MPSKTNKKKCRYRYTRGKRKRKLCGNMCRTGTRCFDHKKKKLNKKKKYNDRQCEKLRKQTKDKNKNIDLIQSLCDLGQKEDKIRGKATKIISQDNKLAKKSKNIKKSREKLRKRLVRYNEKLDDIQEEKSKR